MRLVLISTYPPIECGIATYTQYLTDALRAAGVDVYIVCHAGGSGKNVYPAFDYEDRDLPHRAFSTAMRFTPDVVHIQHEFGLFGPYFGISVVSLILLLRIFDVPVVTTLHTVYSDIPPTHRILYESIIAQSSKVIVHEEFQKNSLLNAIPYIDGNKIAIIPHGARIVHPVEDAKEKLGLPADKKIVLVIGYFRPSKNFELAVDILPEVLKKYPDALLVIAGKIRGYEHKEYRNMLFNRIAASPVKEHIYLIRGQLSQQAFDTILSAADVVVLPYRITSQSGILAHCLAFGKPVVTSSTEAMKQTIARSGSGLTCETRKDYVEAIVKVLSDDEFSKKLSENARQYVKNHISWPIVARRHIDIYSDLAKEVISGVHVVTVD
ncbi:glycosyltransferase [Thermodesulforhabdus norvegica]|uniref:Glycosyltransferase involved in cell wall bisynthesis n=1 Tax=Thermodesulforhabdus norvegica TaxID=39841 RepID=A0A1I4U4F4_9BACT|nr:glycosyltransferase [Thermodesulforhabdus norvegica]SFM83894.1 Glycosyltransferase involved in cell wall bisynthesis [Thermodesulforhabdus norvegica]